MFTLANKQPMFIVANKQQQQRRPERHRSEKARNPCAH